jgi:hypothetical protein
LGGQSGPRRKESKHQLVTPDYAPSTRTRHPTVVVIFIMGYLLGWTIFIRAHRARDVPNLP